VSLTIPARFNGPTGSGNGGVVAGLVAGLTPLTGGNVAQVTLRKPPPLDRPLSVRQRADSLELRDGEDLVATSVAVPFASLGEAVSAVPFAVASGVAADYPGFKVHPFPTCFVCGTERSPGSGLGLTPGPLPGDRSRTATPFVLRPSHLAGNPVADADWIMWAALDCPGGWTIDLLGRPAVLGRMSAQVAEVPEPGEECVVVGALDGRDGRKSFSRSTVYGADGRELARAAATWIDLPTDLAR
jgi:hypothetical protein